MESPRSKLNRTLWGYSENFGTKCFVDFYYDCEEQAMTINTMYKEITLTWESVKNTGSTAKAYTLFETKYF